jgi:hypothetical protein
MRGIHAKADHHWRPVVGWRQDLLRSTVNTTVDLAVRRLTLVEETGGPAATLPHHDNDESGIFTTGLMGLSRSGAAYADY